MIDTNAVELITEWINSLAGVPAAPPPLIDPPGGNLSSAPGGLQIFDADPFATIYYTLDSTLPTTNSAVYTGPLLLASNATVTAMAARSGFVESAPVSSVYAPAGVVLVPQLYEPAAGRFVFGAGPVSGMCVIQTSTNLLNWTSVATNEAQGNYLKFTDTSGSTLGARFYRVLRQ
jgi:hypothetical protein